MSKQLIVFLVAVSIANGLFSLCLRKAAVNGATPPLMAISSGIALIIVGLLFHWLAGQFLGQKSSTVASLAFTPISLKYVIFGSLVWAITLLLLVKVYGALQMSIAYPLVSVGTISVVALIGTKFLHEGFPWTKVIGLLLGGVAIFLLYFPQETVIKFFKKVLG
ncbi:hypothetical protein C4546_02130 [Candidatus Parcubacteria bacterium]|jgi:multidrug transporter EmrE-like cation transporter|nr:MAG: hypothetical protein C4546_02130 [Candidatus Parcubacteria bacterium]